MSWSESSQIKNKYSSIQNHKLNCQCIYCKNKRSETHRINCQCVACKAKRGEYKGKNHPKWKGNKAKCRQIYYCIDNCKAIVSKENGRCRSCSKKGELSPNWKGNQALEKQVYYCIEKGCKNNISYSNFLYGNKRCAKCAGKLRRKPKQTYYCIEENCNKEVSGKDRRCQKCNTKKMKLSFYINSRCNREYFCKKCTRKITWQSKSGLCIFCARKGKLNGMYGKTHNKKFKDIRRKKWKGKNNPKYGKGKDIIGNKNPNYGNGNKIKGENNPNWHGGKSFEPYGIEFNNELKKQVRMRDEYKCKICKCDQKEKRKLDTHHIDYDKKNNNINNLISLCINCHMKTNNKREYWIEYFNKILCI